MKFITTVTAVLSWFLSILFLIVSIISATELFDKNEDKVSVVVALLISASITYGLHRFAKYCWSYNRTNSEEKTEKQTTKPTLFTLKQMSEVILADDVVHIEEARQLLNFLKDHNLSELDPSSLELYQVLSHSLEDDALDFDEASELRVLLSEICDRELSRIDIQPRSSNTDIRLKKQIVTSNQHLTEQLTPFSENSNKRAIQSEAELSITYSDATGNQTSREIIFRRLSKKGSTLYLNAICKMRGGYRTFRVDRIIDLTIIETGEYISDSVSFFSQT